MYTLTLTPIDGYEDEIRLRLGVELEDLSNDEINSLSIAGAAELELLELAPALATLVDERELNYFSLAFINMAAFVAWPGLRLKLLQIESDNKTVAQRFAKALEFDPIIFKQDALKYLAKISSITVSTAADVAVFDVVKPSNDEITGTLNA